MFWGRSWPRAEPALMDSLISLFHWAKTIELHRSMHIKLSTNQQCTKDWHFTPPLGGDCVELWTEGGVGKTPATRLGNRATGGFIVQSSLTMSCPWYLLAQGVPTQSKSLDRFVFPVFTMKRRLPGPGLSSILHPAIKIFTVERTL